MVGYEEAAHEDGVNQNEDGKELDSALEWEANAAVFTHLSFSIK